jgi:uncharacterized membrane protein
MMGPAGWIWMLVWIAALLFMVWLIVRRAEGDTPAEDARAILRARFARGEISETEFERACSVLATDRLETTQ